MVQKSKSLNLVFCSISSCIRLHKNLWLPIYRMKLNLRNPFFPPIRRDNGQFRRDEVTRFLSYLFMNITVQSFYFFFSFSFSLLPLGGEFVFQTWPGHLWPICSTKISQKYLERIDEFYKILQKKKRWSENNFFFQYL